MIECDECGTCYVPITDAYKCPCCGAENYPDDCPDTIEGLSSLAGVQPTAEHLEEWRKLRESKP